MVSEQSTRVKSICSSHLSDFFPISPSQISWALDFLLLCPAFVVIIKTQNLKSEKFFYFEFVNWIPEFPNDLSTQEQKKLLNWLRIRSRRNNSTAMFSSKVRKSAKKMIRNPTKDYRKKHTVEKSSGLTAQRKNSSR